MAECRLNAVEKYLFMVCTVKSKKLNVSVDCTHDCCR